MTSVFLYLLNMSITAGWLVLAVVLLRLVFRRAPKWIHCLLWVLVAVRLLCPVSIESVLSLIPSAETVPVDTFLYDTPSIHSGVPVVDAVVNPVISNGFAPTPENSVNPMQVATTVAAYVWVAGIAAMLLYAVISTLRLRWQVREAAFVRENIWQCDRIATPFILGIFRPCIYLPTLLGAEEAHSVVAHEQAHLSRKDHWWKPLGFLLLTVYWFNPLLWVGYILLCRDIEAACDQRVVRNMDAEGRKEYSRVLLACSAPRHLVSACPLAFGETGVKSRIKSVLNYKKPAFWLVITAIVATVVAAVCLLTNPISGDSLPEDMDTFLSQAIIDYNRSEHTGDAYPTEAHTVFGFRRAFGRTTVYAMVLYEEYYVDENGALQVQSGSHIPTVLTVGEKEGSYTLLDYRIPRDGSDYVKDIKMLFPARLWGKVDITLYSKQHCAATLAAAREHFSPWQTALHQAILANNRKEGDNVFAAESHRIYGVTEGENTLTVYALVHYQEYQMVDGILTERSGSLVPTAITFTKNVDTYDLLQYWIPGDNWADSIREKFPEYLWDKALDYKNYPAEELKAESLAKAQAYFGVGDTTDRNTFTGRVTQVSANGKQMLMDCYDTDKFTQVWVSLQNIPDANPQVGEEYIVTHDQWVQETYPPQVTALRIIPVSSTPTVSDSPLSLTVEVAPSGALLYEDTAVAEYNYTLALTAQKDLVQVCLVSLDPDSSTVSDTLYTMPALTKGQRWYIRTYINDAVANRGVVCTDKQGAKYSFAFTYSGQDGTISLKPLKYADTTTTTTTTTTTIPTTTTTVVYVPNTKKTTELTEQQKGKIVADFAHYLWYEEEWRNYENLEQTKQSCAFRAYYGTYNGYMVVKLGTGFGPAMITEHDMADGYYFSVNGDEYIYLYRDGEFIGLSGAYKSGLITLTDIKDIWYYSHGGKYPVKGPVYGMDITPNPAPPTTTTTTTTLPTSTIVNKIVSPVSVGFTPYEGVSGKSIPYKEVQDLGFQIVPESWVETGIVSSYQQLKTQTGGTAGSLAPLLGKYNEAFFQDYALVVVSYNETIPIYSPDYDINYVSDLKVNGDTLSILLLLGGPKPPENVKDWPTEMYQNNLVLEVKKDDIKTIKKIVPLRMVDYPAWDVY